MSTTLLRNRPALPVTTTLLTIMALAVLVGANWVAAPSDGAKASAVVFTTQFGTSGSDQATAITVDASGVYVTGSTTGAFPGQINSGASDVFVRKFTFDGTLLWTRQFGTDSSDESMGIAVDGSGIYVAGTTRGTLLFQTSKGGADAFIRKYDLSGHVIWTRQFGTGGDESVGGIVVDPSGVYIGGGTSAVFPGHTPKGNSDGYVRKYDPDGTHLWTRQFGSGSFDSAQAVGLDASGVYVAGRTSGAFAGHASMGSSDAFVRKYDQDGAHLWTRQFGTSSGDSARGIATGDSGVFVGGETRGTFPGQTRVGMGGDADGFVRKYDQDGAAQWTRQFGTERTESTGGVVVGATGVYATGDTLGALPGQTKVGPASARNAYVVKYGHDGEGLWIRQFGTTGVDSGQDIETVDSAIYVAGRTTGTFPGETSAGGATDAFLAQLTDEVFFCQGLPVTHAGTEGDDVIHGTNGPDVIAGLGGNDTIHGNGGDDVICGGDGNDTVYGGNGNDTIHGEDGNDTVFGNAGDDLVYGGDGDDTVYGNSGTDFIFGGNGHDILDGGWGTDIVKGEAGNDRLIGGQGVGDGADIVAGGPGDDLVFGGPGDDVLWGGAGRDQLHGEDGDDLLQGNHRKDLLRGGRGNDALYGDQRYPDPANSDPAGDDLFGDQGDDQLFGQEGDDDLDGGPDTDACDGGPGANTVVNCE